MKKIKSMKNIRNLFYTAGTRHGSYSVGLTVLVIAAVIVFNLIVGQIPEAYRNLDVSSTKIYDISDTTTELLDSLDKEVDLTVLAVKDETDERITTFLSKYAALSDKIKMDWIDPVLHPSALTEYEPEPHGGSSAFSSAELPPAVQHFRIRRTALDPYLKYFFFCDLPRVFLLP